MYTYIEIYWLKVQKISTVNSALDVYSFHHMYTQESNIRTGIKGKLVR